VCVYICMYVSDPRRNRFYNILNDIIIIINIIYMYPGATII